MLSDTVEHFHQFSQADLKSMEAEQIGLDLSKGQAHHGMQASDEAGNSEHLRELDYLASMWQNGCLEIQAAESS